MRRFRLRLLWLINSEAHMIAAGQNLKRLLQKRGWGCHPYPAEALDALFLAAFGWGFRPICEEWSFFLLIDTDDCTVIMKYNLLTDELYESIFQQAESLCDMARFCFSATMRRDEATPRVL